MTDHLCRRDQTPQPAETFEEVVLPHLNAAYRLARWLMRNTHDAEDAVQEASLRAFRYFRTYAGGNGRAWFLQIVRHTCYGWRGRRDRALADVFDEERHSTERTASNPEALLLQADTAFAIGRAIDGLPHRYRELLTLREVEGLTYRQLADVMGLPMGTVMSRLSRARRAVRGATVSTRSLCRERAGVLQLEYRSVPDAYPSRRKRSAASAALAV